MSAGVLIVILSLFVVLPFLSSLEACGISVYWGQNENEGTLGEACSAPNPLYNYISIAFLDTFGSAQTPLLNLTAHCSPATCTTLAPQIISCQQKGIKVLLSLGGPRGSYNLDSQQDASQFAEFLYYTYLGGGGGGPLGNAVLDGVNFDIQVPGSSNYWDYLVRAISAYTKPDDGKAFYLSAAVGCSYPDPIMDAAIKTGVLDSVWVKFYDNPNCDITSGVGGVLKAWNRWSYSVYPTQLFMGLAGFSSATTTGYIDENTLMNKILPVIKYSPNYGGMMVWNRYYDVLANYSATVSPYLCPRPPPKSMFFE